jgi:carbonic anhydrase
MKKLAKQLLVASMAIGFASASFGAQYFTTKAELNAMTPAAALAELKAGNQRFLDDKRINYPFLKIAKATAEQGQNPIAFILSCIDSRVDARLLFDQGLANLFVGAVAGNVFDTNLLASMEFATKAMGSKLIVVMGHTQCGAIAAACHGGAAFGHVDDLIKALTPAVTQAKSLYPNGSCDNMDFVNTVAKQNVLINMQNVMTQSPVAAALVKAGKVRVIGAMQDLETGKISFFDERGSAL